MSRKKLVLTSIIFILVGLLIGYTLGISAGVGICARIGIKFLEAKGIEIDIKPNEIANALMQYRGRFDDINISIKK